MIPEKYLLAFQFISVANVQAGGAWQWWLHVLCCSLTSEG